MRGGLLRSKFLRCLREFGERCRENVETVRATEDHRHEFATGSWQAHASRQQEITGELRSYRW